MARVVDGVLCPGGRAVELLIRHGNGGNAVGVVGPMAIASVIGEAESNLGDAVMHGQLGSFSAD
jgi:hypothetical protein